MRCIYRRLATLELHAQRLNHVILLADRLGVSCDRGFELLDTLIL
jgi:hypothetical protein